MKTGKLLTKWTAVLCAVLLMISLFAIPAFADTTSASDTSNETTAEETTVETAANTTDNAETTKKDEAETTGTSNTDKKDDAANDNAGLSVSAIIWIVVGAVLVIAAVILGIKYREKIAKGLRVYKSEFKKVSWLSWEQTRKSTLVVVVVLIAFAAVICLLDIALFQGFDALLNAFGTLFSNNG